MTETEQLLKLSLIYQHLITDIECLANITLNSAARQQVFQLVSDAVDEAYEVKHELAHEWDDIKGEDN